MDATAFNLGALALLAAMVGLAAAYGIDALSRKNRAPHDGAAVASVDKTIAGQSLAIPASALRYEDQMTTGFAERIDMVAVLPLGTNERPVTIDISLVPKNRVRPSAVVLDHVYLHKFQSRQVDGPPGLVGKPLVPGEGYQNETVWYDPLSISPFVAKCASPIAETARTQCIRTVYVNDNIAAIYRFDESVLTRWREFDPAVSGWLEKIGLMR